MKPPYLSDIETDRRIPSEAVIEKLATYYKVDKSELMAIAGKLTPDAEEWLRSTPEAIKLVELMYLQGYDNSAARTLRRSILI
jgi:transcriptional regulator with XRE-family HTH domain